MRASQAKPLREAEHTLSKTYATLAITRMLHHLRDHGVPLARPFAYRGLLQRWLVALGLRRSSAGGFGGTVPQPSSGGHG